MARGVVKFFNEEKGYGFIVPERKVGIAEGDIFVHISDLQRWGVTTLIAGQVVEYELYENRRGRPSAQNLKVVEPESR
jgi:cold shock protein